MMTLRRSIFLSLLAIGLSSCSTLNKVNPFSSKDDGADSPAKEEAAPKSNANFDHAVMTVDVGGKASKVVIKLRPDLAPKHVANFQKQANSGFYDGIAVHRAIRSYLVQTGDPLTRDEGQKINWGTGGSEKKIPAEIKGKHVKGSVAMARLNDSLNPDKSSSSSQFYIMLRGASSLDSGYTVFGEVVSGLDVVEQISSQVVDTNDVPLKRVEVQSIRLIPPTAKELSEPAKKARGQTQTENDKGPFTKFIERIW